MKTFPPDSPQQDRQILERITGSVNAVNICLPQTTPDSGTAAATSGLLNACSTVSWAFSVFVLQTQVALCFLWDQIAAILVTITSLQAQITAITNNMRTPGAVTIVPESSLGVGGTASVTAGTDASAIIHLVAGTGASSGLLATATFATPYTTFPTPVLAVAGGSTITSLNNLKSVALTNGAGFEIWGNPNDGDDILLNYYGVGGT